MFFLIFLIITTLYANGERDTLYILNTTDIHGSILPYDYIKDEPAEYGLVKVYTRIKSSKINMIMLFCLIAETFYRAIRMRIISTGSILLVSTRSSKQ